MPTSTTEGKVSPAGPSAPRPERGAAPPGLRGLLEEISVIAHVPVSLLEENLDVLGRRALTEPNPAIALSRYMLEQQPRLKGCTEHVWRAVDLWLAAHRQPPETTPSPGGEPPRAL